MKLVEVTIVGGRKAWIAPNAIRAIVELDTGGYQVNLSTKLQVWITVESFARLMTHNSPHAGRA